MQIQHITDGSEYVSVSNDGEVIHLGSLSIDLSTRQSDIPQTIAVSRGTDGEPCEGAGSRWFLAHIYLPQVAYEMVDTGEIDPDTGGPIQAQQRLAINMDELRVDLWAMPPNTSEV